MLNEIIVSGRKLELEKFSYMADNAFMSLVLDIKGAVIFANHYFW